MVIENTISQLVNEVSELRAENTELKARLARIGEAFGVPTDNTPQQTAFEPANGHTNGAIVMPRGRTSKLDPADVKKLIAQYRTDTERPVAEIAKEFGVSTYTVYSQLKKAKVALRR